jgi:hypothetical protein
MIMKKVTITLSGKNKYMVKIGNDDPIVKTVRIEGDICPRYVCEKVIPKINIYSPEKVEWCENTWYCWVF